MARETDTFSGNSAYKLYMDVVLKSQSSSNNTSTVEWEVYTIKSSGSGYSSSDLGSGSASVNGSVWSDSSFGYNFTGSTPKTVVHASGTRTISHGSDGKKSFNFSASVSLGSLGSASVSGSVNLPRIPVEPDSPTGISVSTITDDSARISWTAPSDNGGASISSYQVQRATNSGFTSGVSTTTMSSGGTLSGLSSRVKYWVRVRAVNSVGSSSWSSSTSFTTLGTPDAPTSLASSNVAPTSVRLTWTAPSDNGGASISSYTVQRATNSGFTTGVSTSTMTSGSTLGGLAERTSYWIRVRANNSQGAGDWSNVITVTTTGHPTAPTGVTVTPSTSVTGRMAISWTAPAEGGTGGIKGYNIFRNGSQIATTTGTGTSYTDNGLTPYSPYTYTIAARNDYSNSVGGMGPQSSGNGAVAPGPPTAPKTLTAVAGANPGEVNLSWAAPDNAGSGGITGYRVRLADGTLLANKNGTGTTHTVTGLVPGSTYAFRVHARNALSDTEGTESAASNQASITLTVGEPDAPTGLVVNPSSAVPNRLILSWAPGSGLSGYSIFQNVGGTFTLIAKITANHTQFAVDGLTAGTSYSFQVRARTSYTDTLGNGYPGNWGGPPSNTASATATSNFSQSVPSLSAAVSATNAIFNGTYTISQVTANTVRYARTAANIASRASGGSIVNTTNALFNGTYTVTATTANKLSYARTAANVALSAVAGSSIANLTNASMNGTFTATAINVEAKTVSYANTGATVASTTVPVNSSPGRSSKVTNLANTIFNGVGRVITAVTEYTISYSQTNANVAENVGAGIITNTTNRDIFNGTYTVDRVPSYNVIEFVKTASNIATRVWNNPNGIVIRTIPRAALDIRFRSGWAG